MTFRTRLALSSAVAVAVAVVAASVGAYFLVQDQLVDEVDAALLERARVFGPFDGMHPRRGPEPRFGGAGGYVQVVTPTGTTLRPGGADSTPLPVTDATLAVAAGSRDAFLADVDVDGVHLRVLTTPLRGAALQVARPLDEVDQVLSELRTGLVVIGSAGIALAVALGLIVAGTAVRPLRRLSHTAGEIAETGDLSRRVGLQGDDELARLARRFDEMLVALEESQGAQRRLVADASHEFRTPIAVVRTNIDLLARHGELSPDDRAKALAVAREQLEELSLLVTDIVELARAGTETPPAMEPIRLDDIVVDAVERTRRVSPSIRFVVEAEESVIDGDSARIHRAVTNLLQNAVKWSPDLGVVEVGVRGAEVTVRDHGPGVAAADRPHVFDRFYRADAARGTPGTGLGLAIVRQVVELHGGSATVDEAEGGGALFRVRFSPNH